MVINGIIHSINGVISTYNWQRAITVWHCFQQNQSPFITSLDSLDIWDHIESYETMRRQNGIPGIGRHRINPYRYGLVATWYIIILITEQRNLIWIADLNFEVWWHNKTNPNPRIQICQGTPLRSITFFIKVSMVTKCVRPAHFSALFLALRFFSMHIPITSALWPCRIWVWPDITWSFCTTAILVPIRTRLKESFMFWSIPTRER